MKNVIRLLIILLSIVLGLYVGVWLMFVGGIIQIIQSAITPINALGIALGLLRVVCASFVGWLSFYIGAIVGVSFLN
jgi:hypothetical protein